MRTSILAAALLALAIAGPGCNKDNSKSGAALDAQGAAKSAGGHHMGKHGKMHEGMHEGMHGKMDGAGPMDPKEHAAKITEALGLDADQSAKIEKLFADNAPRQQALRDRMLKLHQEMSTKKDDGTLDDKAMQTAKTAMAEVKAEKHKMHQELAAAIDAILTPEQKAKHQQMMAEHHGDKMGHHCDGDCDCAGKGEHECNGDCDHAGKGEHECGGDCDHAGKMGDGTCPHADKMGDGTCPHATEGGECPHKAEHHPGRADKAAADKAAAE